MNNRATAVLIMADYNSTLSAFVEIMMVQVQFCYA